MGLKVALITATLVLTASGANLVAGEAPATDAWKTMNVAVLGDIGRAEDMVGIERRLDVIAGTGVDAASRPDAIEIATDVDLGPELNRFEAFDRAVRLAKDRKMKLFLRVKPHVKGEFERCRLRETKLIRDGGPEFKTGSEISFLDPRYIEAVRRYFSAVASRYAQEETVLGYGIGICPSGETQYQIDGTFFGDFSDAAFNDYKAWMENLGEQVTAWPPMPRHITPDTRISCDGPYYLFTCWRAQRLGRLLSEMAAEIKRVAPRALVSAFSYAELAPPACYGPGFLEDDPNVDWYFGSISLDHGYFGVRGQDRSRPETVAGRKLVAAEFDLISAYTDPAHMETYARYLLLMNGQPRPFLPTWWSAGKKGGWGEGFWAPYSDDLARRMTRVVNENKRLYGTKSVTDVVVINPNVSGMGVMAGWGPWTSEEYRTNHTDIVRQLSSIGANFDLLTEDTLTAEKLKPYRLVVVNAPALYPWVRKALTESKAHVLALCWAGTVVAPGPEEKSFSHAWKNGVATWWATQGTGVERVARVRFEDVALAGGLQGKDLAYAQEKRPVSYVRGMKGTPIAKDDEGRTVFASTDWNGRRLYHFGIPLSLKSAGRVMTDLQFREILTAVLREAGCTAYGDLGPLRLYETARWLLVENPNGTTGTVAEPRGDFEGALPVRTQHPPMPEYLTADGQLKLRIPAGSSVVIPLKP